MSVNRYLSPEIQAKIRQRANYLCEYYHDEQQLAPYALIEVESLIFVLLT